MEDSGELLLLDCLSRGPAKAAVSLKHMALPQVGLMYALSRPGLLISLMAGYDTALALEDTFASQMAVSNKVLAV